MISKLVRESIYEGENPYFKGPSRERIEKAIVGMSLEEKFFKGLLNNVVWLVERCIDEGYDSKEFLNFAFQFSSEHNYLNMLRLILKKTDIDPSQDDNSAIRIVSRFKNKDILKELINNPIVNKKLADKEKRIVKTQILDES